MSRLKESHKIIGCSITAAALFWLVDAAVDTSLSGGGTFPSNLLFDKEQAAIRLLFSLCFLAFGLFMAVLHNRRKRREEDLLNELSRLKGAAASLRESASRTEDERAKLEAIITAIGDGISVQDTDLRVQYQNDVHKAMVGGARTGEYCYRAYQRRDRPCEGCHLLESFQDGRIHKKEQVREGRFYEIVSSPLRDAAGGIVAGIELVRDITDRKLTERALAESENRYRMLFENAADAIFILEAEGPDAGRIVAANRAAAEMHDYTADELARLRITDLDAPGSAQASPALMARILNGEWVKADISHRRKDGTVFPVEMSAGLLEFGGRKYILAFDRDSTARREAEAGREALIVELREAIDNIQTLRGMLPICASCKKIRDDKGYWNQIESYISSHTLADFSHGLCPDCVAQLYPGYSDLAKERDSARE